jgi:fatty acid desaturase
MDLVDEVAEPFRSDERFWRSVSASADALATLMLAIAAALALALTVGGVWPLMPFALPAVLLVRAAHNGHASAQDSRASFSSAAEWRDAERLAVARVFRRVLLRNRFQQVHKQNG